MNFESLDQHSPKQLLHIRELISRHHQLPRQVQLWLAVQLVQHGWPKARESLGRLREQFSSDDVRHFLKKLINETYITQEIVNWEKLFRTPNFLNQFYQLNGYIYQPGTHQKQKLVILFSTMFNNFYVSNAIMVSLLRTLGVSVLLLKDATRYQYLKGVKGLGNNLSQVADSIQGIVKRESIKEVYILGFSSGGYGSLLLSTQMPCQGYLGFSIHTHIGDKESFPLGKYWTPDVISQLSQDVVLDLAKVVRKEGGYLPRTLVYGLDSKEDKIQAMNLSSCDQVKIVGFSDCGHMTVAKAIEDHSFMPMLESFISSGSK